MRAGNDGEGGILALTTLILTKLAHGAWLPLLIAMAAFVVMTTWQRGRALVSREREQVEGSLTQFVASLHARGPGPTSTW